MRRNSNVINENIKHTHKLERLIFWSALKHISVLNLSTADVRQLVKLGDIDKLEQIIYDGQGKKLAGYPFASDPKVRELLKGIPALMVSAFGSTDHRFHRQVPVEDILATRRREQRKGRRTESSPRRGARKAEEADFGQGRGRRGSDTQGRLLRPRRYLQVSHRAFSPNRPPKGRGKFIGEALSDWQPSWFLGREDGVPLRAHVQRQKAHFKAAGRRRRRSERFGQPPALPQVLPGPQGRTGAAEREQVKQRVEEKHRQG